MACRRSSGKYRFDELRNRSGWWRNSCRAFLAERTRVIDRFGASVGDFSELCVDCTEEEIVRTNGAEFDVRVYGAALVERIPNAEIGCCAGGLPVWLGMCAAFSLWIRNWTCRFWVSSSRGGVSLGMVVVGWRVKRTVVEEHRHCSKYIRSCWTSDSRQVSDWSATTGRIPNVYDCAE